MLLVFGSFSFLQPFKDIMLKLHVVGTINDGRKSVFFLLQALEFIEHKNTTVSDS